MLKNKAIRLAAVGAALAAGAGVGAEACKAAPARPSAAACEHSASLHQSDPIWDLIWLILEVLRQAESQLEGLAVDEAIVVIADDFHNDGFPEGMSQSEIDAALACINQLQSIFQSTPLPPSVDSTEAAAFLVVLGEMREVLLPPN